MTTTDKVREVLSQQLDCDLAKLVPEYQLRQLYERDGLDSLGMVEIILALEEMFEIDIPDEEAAVVEKYDAEHTIADLAAYVDRKVAEARAR